MVEAHGSSKCHGKVRMRWMSWGNDGSGSSLPACLSNAYFWGGVLKQIIEQIQLSLKRAPPAIEELTDKVISANWDACSLM